jgi:hypothetical protein
VVKMLHTGVVAGIFLAGLGLGILYNYGVLLPKQQAAVQAGNAQEEHRPSELQRAAQAGKAARAEQSLTTCLGATESDYSASWDRACESQAEQNADDRETCASQGHTYTYCFATYPETMWEKCGLPAATAQDIEARRKSAREECYKKAQLGGP